MKRRAVSVSLLILALVWCYTTRVGSGCSWPSETVFVFLDHPDLPLERFVEGKFGIVAPTFSRSFLVVAYRYFSGMRFNEVEQKELIPVWTMNTRFAPLDFASARPKEASDIWVETRRLVTDSSAPGRIVEMRYFHSASADSRQQFWYLNCSADAFRTATATLNQRIKQFGSGSPIVKDWLRAQDQVFANCADGKVIPAAASPDAPPLVRADRAYQIAAAHFYAEDYDAAQEKFKEIAADASSPWREWAPYLVARAMIRKATLLAPENQTDTTTLAQAENQLRNILANKGLRAAHPPARRLLNFVTFRLHPEERLHELAQALMARDTGTTLDQDLIDYRALLNRFLDDEDVKRLTERWPTMTELRQRDDLTDWILTFQAGGQASFEHSIEKWKLTKSVPWLIATLTKVDPGHPMVPALMQAAEKVKPGSPEYLTVKFQLFRLEIQSGKEAEARRQLDDLLAKNPNLPRSSLNMFLALRTVLARDVDDLLKFSLRSPAGSREADMPDERYAYDEPTAGVLGDDVAMILNRKMPLRALLVVAQSKTLPENIRLRTAFAVWVRANLLGDRSSADKLVPLLKELYPGTAPQLEAVRSATSPEAREFAAVFLIMRFSGMSPYVSSAEESTAGMPNGGWWGHDSPNSYRREYASNFYFPEDSYESPAKFLYPDHEIPFPSFLSENDKKNTEDEVTHLESIPAAPLFFLQTALDWASKHPDDLRVPEALHRAILSVHRGSRQEGTADKAREAFRLLHRRYANSAWAKKTKYWYAE